MFQNWEYIFCWLLMLWNSLPFWWQCRAEGNADDSHDDYDEGDDDGDDGDGDERAVQASVLRCHCQLSAASWSRLPQAAFAFGQVSTPAAWMLLHHQGLGVIGRASAHQELWLTSWVTPSEGFFRCLGLKWEKPSGAACSLLSCSWQKPQSGFSSTPLTRPTRASLLKLKLRQKPKVNFEYENG